MKKTVFFFCLAVLLSACSNSVSNQDLVLNELGYFEAQGVNVLVYSNLFTEASM